MRNALTPKLRTRLAAVASGALMLVALAAGGPAMAQNATDRDLAEVQVQEVTSSSPMMVEDLEAQPAGVTATFYCAVRDGTFGCKDANPGTGLVVATLFQHRDFNRNDDGWRIVVFNPAYEQGCTSGTGNNEGGANLGHENAVSSVKTFNQCDVKLFDGYDKSGASTSFIDRDNYLGGFNDRANSFRIS